MLHSSFCLDAKQTTLLFNLGNLPLTLKTDEDSDSSLRLHSRLDHGFTDCADVALAAAVLDHLVYNDVENVLQTQKTAKTYLSIPKKKTKSTMLFSDDSVSN